jgi:hypothetical protein
MNFGWARNQTHSPLWDNARLYPPQSSAISGPSQQRFNVLSSKIDKE